MNQSLTQVSTRSASPVRALDARYYTDPQVYATEQAQLFTTTWQFAGHLSQVENRGDYFSFEIAGQSLFCIRGKDDEIRAFYNVCQHRAHEMVSGDGNCRALTCPYHAWTYELDGRLRAGPNIGAVPGLDKGEICLTEVRSETFHGFIFVNLDPDAKPMDEWFPGVREGLKAYVPNIESLQPLETVEIEEACNWKVSVENYSECYHCGINHPTFTNGVINPKTYNIQPRRYALWHTTESQNLDQMTYPIDPAANAHATDYHSWFLWPCFSFQVYPGNILNSYRWRPQSVDRVMVDRGWYSAPGEETEVIHRLARQDRETTVEEDIRLVESVQRGLQNRGYRAGPLVLDPDEGVLSEHSIYALHQWIREALEQHQ